MTAPKHTPHPVAVLDAPQWLRTFAMQYKGETRATLEHCAAKLEGAPELLEALRTCDRMMDAIGSDLPAWAMKTYVGTKKAIAKAEAAP